MKLDYKIMIIDDEKVIGIYVKKSLEKNEPGFHVDHYDLPLTAYEVLKKEKYDLLIIDLVMPQMSGFNLSESIRKIEGYENTPIVIYSSVISNEDKYRALSSPIYAEGFISKSDDSIDVLVHQIRSIFWRNEAKEMTERVKTIKDLGKSIAHKASQSLTAINGYSEILQKNINENNFDKEKFFRFIDIIKKSSKDIGDLLEYVKNIKEIEIVDIGDGDKIIKVSDNI